MSLYSYAVALIAQRQHELDVRYGRKYPRKRAEYRLHTISVSERRQRSKWPKLFTRRKE